MPVTNKYNAANVVVGAGMALYSPRDVALSTYTAVASPAATTTTFSVLVAGIGDLAAGDMLILTSAGTPTFLAPEASTMARVVSVTLNGANYDVVVSPAFSGAPPTTAGGVKRVWKNLGASDGGIELTLDKSVIDQMIDQSQTPVTSSDDKLDVSIKIPCAEQTLQNFAIAAGLPDPSSATAWSINSTDASRTDRYLIITKMPNSTNLFFVGHKGKSSGKGTLKAAKNDKSIFSVEVKLYADTAMTPDLCSAAVA